MVVEVRHEFVNAIPDDPEAEAAGETLPSHWNADHVVEGAAETAHTHAGEDIASGTVADARVAGTLARDTEVTAAVNAHALTSHTDDQTAAEVPFTPAGGIAATNVQAGMEELDTEKAALASAVMDGDAAGGDLSGTYPNPSVVDDSHNHNASTAPGAGGLPPQWTDGGNGDVTAETDNDTTPITVVAPESGSGGAYGLAVTPAGPAFTGAILVLTGDPADLAGDGYVLRVMDNAAGRQTFDLDSWGSMMLAAAVDGGGGLQVLAGDDELIMQVNAGPDLANSTVRSWVRFVTDRIDVNETLRITKVAAPVDGEFVAGSMGFWFDPANGAASPMWKGKSADGTVVSGTLGGGSVTPATDPGAVPAAIADPTLATAEDVALKFNALQAWAEDLRDNMIAAGLVA